MRTVSLVTKTTRPQGATEYAPLDPEALVQRRVELGLLQKEVAARAGISPQFLADIEAGRRNGSPATRVAIAKALRRPLRELQKKREAAA